jgi:hypothetical protein
VVSAGGGVVACASAAAGRAAVASASALTHRNLRIFNLLLSSGTVNKLRTAPACDPAKAAERAFRADEPNRDGNRARRAE